MANLGDFDPDTDSVPFDQLHDIDKWVLSHLNNLVKTCRKGYGEYEFHTVYHAINNFCTNDLSKLYVDITKDRVYTERADSKERRCAQTAMYTVASALTRLLAPVLSFTAEEIWQTMPHLKSENAKSVFLNDMPDYDAALEFADVTAPLDKLFQLRDDVMKALEIARADKMIGKSLDAKVTVYTEDAEQLALLESFRDQLALFFITSDAAIVNGTAPAGALTETESGIGVLVEQMDGRKCDRCWMLVTDGIIIPADGESEESCLCPRCHRIIQRR